MVVIKFLICAVLIYFSGSRLSKYGDILAEKTGLGHAWMGLVLLAAITSLPEMFNGISAVAFVGAPDLAVGNIVGACLINMAVIGVLDILLFFRKKPFIFSDAGEANNLSIKFGLIIAGVFLAGVILAKKYFDFTVLGVGIYTIIIFLLYILAQHLVYNSEKNRNREGEVLEHKRENTRDIVLKFIFFALIVIAAGIWLPYIGDEMALSYGLGKSFVGVFFLGIATTLPELTVSATALRYSVGMSLGNLIGSNVFNFSLLFLDDIFYRGSLLKSVSFSQFVAGLFLLFSFIVVFSAIKNKYKSRLVSVALILSYVIGICGAYFIK